MKTRVVSMLAVICLVSGAFFMFAPTPLSSQATLTTILQKGEVQSCKKVGPMYLIIHVKKHRGGSWECWAKLQSNHSNDCKDGKNHHGVCPAFTSEICVQCGTPGHSCVQNASSTYDSLTAINSPYTVFSATFSGHGYSNVSVAFDAKLDSKLKPSGPCK